MPWIIPHVARYKRFILSVVLATLVGSVLSAAIPSLTGLAFNEVLRPQPDAGQLLTLALGLAGVVLLRGAVDLAGRFSAEFLAKRFQRDARDELYASLLGKSQTFHNRQRVGDIMARANNDAWLLSDMIVPGADIIFDSFVNLAMTCLFIGLLNPQLLLAPVLFTVAFLIALRFYMRQLAPVNAGMREQFGTLNAGLTEAVTGIEVVKATAQEDQEQRKFEQHASK